MHKIRLYMINDEALGIIKRITMTDNNGNEIDIHPLSYRLDISANGFPVCTMSFAVDKPEIIYEDSPADTN